jgi:hypothetical protein
MCFDGLRSSTTNFFSRMVTHADAAFKLLGCFWDALTRQRTDGALVRLITPVYAGEEAADADRRLAEFTQAIVPVLNEFLPK